MGILEIIKERSELSIAEYMRMCLTHPQFGYYTNQHPIGREGDFITAPEISQMFGEVIGAWVANEWLNLGAPPRLNLVELGPGRGTLMQDLLRATKGVKGFHPSLSVIMCEVSPTLQGMQKIALENFDVQTQWVDSFYNFPDSLTLQQQEPVIFIANEFFDALPIHQYIYTASQWKERGVQYGEHGLQFCALEGGVSADFLGNFPQPSQGCIWERCPDGLEIIRCMAEIIGKVGGAALIIDYGHIKRGFGDTLQAVKNHKYCSVLESLGEVDITAHVDFEALAEVARGCKVAAELLTQREFLLRCGIKQRADYLLSKTPSDTEVAEIISGLERLTSPTQMGELFKAMILTT